LIDICIFSTEAKSQGNKTKKNERRFFSKGSVFENKNHEKSNKQTQNWKNIEKKTESEEKLEKKENRKKGERYYKNIRQAKHLEKLSD